MIVALTGTPGTGKSSVSKILRRKYIIMNLNKIIQQHNFISGYDRERRCRIADMKKLNGYIKKQNKGKTLIVEGHLAHLLSVDMIIVLRCSPKILGKRLGKKKYPKKKIMENAEAEAVDVITVESLEKHKKVYEIDTTNISKEKVAEKVEEILSGRFKNYEVGNIDWSEEILTWYSPFLFLKKKKKSDWRKRKRRRDCCAIP